MTQTLRVQISDIRKNGQISVDGELTAGFGPARTAGLSIGDVIEVEIDQDDYPIRAQTLDGEQIWSAIDIGVDQPEY